MTKWVKIIVTVTFFNGKSLGSQMKIVKYAVLFSLDICFSLYTFLVLLESSLVFMYEKGIFGGIFQHVFSCSVRTRKLSLYSFFRVEEGVFLHPAGSIFFLGPSHFGPLSWFYLSFKWFFIPLHFTFFHCTLKSLPFHSI